MSIARSVGIGGILVLVVCQAGESQGRPRATLADSVMVTENVFHALFDDIVLTHAVSEQARAIIRQTIRLQYEGQRGTLAEQRRRATLLNARRDSALAQLISSPSDRTLFWDRAAAIHSGRRPPEKAPH